MQTQHGWCLVPCQSRRASEAKPRAAWDPAKLNHWHVKADCMEEEEEEEKEEGRSFKRPAATLKKQKQNPLENFGGSCLTERHQEGFRLAATHVSGCVHVLHVSEWKKMCILCGRREMIYRRRERCKSSNRGKAEGSRDAARSSR